MYGLGDLNCPGDPGCPGYVAPDSSAYQTSLLQEILSNQSAAVAPVVSSAPAAGSLTAWLNANSTALWIGAAGFLALAMFSGGRRR